MIKMNVSGIDALLRTFDRKIDGVEDALSEGCDEAADYLIECIEDKFGVYQPGWAKLTYETVKKKINKGNGANANKPLVDYGDMMFSFKKITSNRTRKHTVTVSSDDPRIKWHVYGARGAGVPRRDPVRPTIAEERQKIFEIVKDKVMEVLRDDK